MLGTYSFISPLIRLYHVSSTQIDPTARITSPSATILCYCSNLATGVIDPMVYLTRRKQYREEIKVLIWPAPPMRTSTEVKSRCKTTG